MNVKNLHYTSATHNQMLKLKIGRHFVELVVYGELLRWSAGLHEVKCIGVRVRGYRAMAAAVLTAGWFTLVCEIVRFAVDSGLSSLSGWNDAI